MPSYLVGERCGLHARRRGAKDWAKIGSRSCIFPVFPKLTSVLTVLSAIEMSKACRNDKLASDNCLTSSEN